MTIENFVEALLKQVRYQKSVNALVQAHPGSVPVNYDTLEKMLLNALKNQTLPPPPERGFPKTMARAQKLEGRDVFDMMPKTETRTAGNLAEQRALRFPYPLAYALNRD